MAIIYKLINNKGVFVGFGSSPHAVEQVLNRPSLRGAFQPASFSNLKDVNPQYQVASFEAGVLQSRSGLEQAQDARVALAAAAKAAPGGGDPQISSNGPSFIKEGLKMVGAGAAAIAFPQFAGPIAAISMLDTAVNAVRGAMSPIDREYQQSSFKSAANSSGKYHDVMGGVWDEDGWASAEPVPQAQSPQPMLMQAAQGVVAERGSKNVMKDLAVASQAEDKLQQQLGSNIEFAEKNMNIKSAATGPKAPSWAMG